MATMTLNKSQRKKVVDHIVANCGCKNAKIFNESDRPLLEGTEDSRLMQIFNSLRKALTTEAVANKAQSMLRSKGITLVINDDGGVMPAKCDPANDVDCESSESMMEAPGDLPEGGTEKDLQSENEDEEEEFPEEEFPENEDEAAGGCDPNDPGCPSGAGTQQVGVSNRRLTEAQWLAMAPKSVREDLSFARNQKAQQKKTLINRITANSRGNAKARLVNMLQRKPLGELQLLANALPVGNSSGYRQADYTGAAAPAVNASGGKSRYDEDDVLPLPTMNMLEEEDAARKERVAKLRQA